MAKKKTKNNPKGKALERRVRNYEAIEAAKAKARAERKQAVPYIKEAVKAAGHGMEIPIKTALGAAKGALKGLALGDKERVTSAAWKEAIDTNPLSESLKQTKNYYKGATQAMKHLGKAAFNSTKAVVRTLFNDLSWYDNYPETTAEMIGPNFNVPIGTYDDLYDLNSNSTYKIGVPSFAQIKLNLVRGDDSDGAVTASINRLFTSIRQANSGSVNWSAYQLDAYIYNWRLIIALYSCYNRALKCLNKYHVSDKNVPYAALSACGFDYNALAQNAAAIRNRLNTVRTRLMGYAIPKLDILKRTYWLFDKAFWDSNDFKHQTYIMVPVLTKYYNMSQNALVNLGNTPFPAGPSTTLDGTDPVAILAMLNTLLNEFMQNDVYSIISGDIVKAYGAENLFVLDTVATTEELMDEGYSEEVLQQIQNAYIPMTDGSSGFMHTLTHTNTTDVGLTEAIAYTESTYSNIPTYTDDHSIINMYKNNITNLDILGATRFMAFITRSTSTFTVSTYGTELFAGMMIPHFNYTSLNSNPHKLQYKTLYNMSIVDYTTAANVESYSFKTTFWTIFDWMPRQIQFINYYTSGSTTSSTGIGGTLFDLNIYAHISSITELRNIHNIAIQSLYYTPLLSRVVNNLVTYGN